VGTRQRRLPGDDALAGALLTLFVFLEARVLGRGLGAISSSSSRRGDCSGGVVDPRCGRYRRSPSTLGDIRPPLVRGRSLFFVFVPACSFVARIGPLSGCVLD